VANNFIDNTINKNQELTDFPEKVEFVQLAFILNDIVEKVMNFPQTFSEVVLSGYTFIDKTEEKKEELGPEIFEFILESKNGKTLKIHSTEEMWAILASNPLVLKVPDDLDVQFGWRYTSQHGFMSN
jgi:hypothetical protein